MTKQPIRRQKKSDRLITPHASKDEIMIDFAIGPFDRLTREMERKWGVDMLPELVSAETASKYGYAMASLNEHIEANDLEGVKKWVGVCMRGLIAMDGEAENSGVEPASDLCWIVEAEGRRYGLLRDPRGWQRASEKYPDVELVTPREMVLALAAYQQTVVKQTYDQIKQWSPGAEVTAFRFAGEDNLDDLPL